MAAPSNPTHPSRLRAVLLRTGSTSTRTASTLVALALSGVTLSGVAAAAPSGFDAQRFKPALDGRDFLSLPDSVVGAPMSFGGGFVFDYADAPLVYRYDDPSRTETLVVDQMGTVDTQAWFNTKRVRFGLDMPTHIFALGYGVNEPALLGDLRLEATGELIRRRGDGFGLGARLMGSLPTGSQEENLGAGRARLGAGLLGSVAAGPALVSGDLAFFSPDGSTFPETELQSGPELRFGLGTSLSVTDSFAFGAELVGGHSFGENISNSTPVEALGNIRLLPEESVVLRLGGGAGITRGVGAPAWRAVAALTWSPGHTKTIPQVASDRDKDGIDDRIDKCSDQAEDLDGQGDDDGCPEGGLVPTFLRVQDDQGDLVVGARLRLVEGPETGSFRLGEGKLSRSLPPGNYRVVVEAQGFEPAYEDLSVPAEAPGVEKMLRLSSVARTGRVVVHVRRPDGTAAPARFLLVGEGVERHIDSPDGLLTVAVPPGAYTLYTSATGFRTEDRAITIEERGTTDMELVLDPGKVRIEGDRVIISERVFFETDSDVILRRSFPLLDEVARTLLIHDELELVSVNGHTDDQGEEEYNLGLSLRRAKAVRVYLIQSGVAAERLSAEGFGEAEPLLMGTTEEARSANRRVELRIVRQRAPESTETL